VLNIVRTKRKKSPQKIFKKKKNVFKHWEATMEAKSVNKYSNAAKHSLKRSQMRLKGAQA
jgi:hypothetical protein